MFYGNMGRLKASELPRASLEVRCAGFCSLFSSKGLPEGIVYTIKATVESHKKPAVVDNGDKAKPL